jgi:hypothetical protein
MTSFRQLQANRCNALKSTGPATAEGKRQSRCNAVRHGLTAETVIATLEDAEDYKAFEAAIIADYDAQSAVERELVLRLASLLWRLRRATTMETGLFEIQAERLREPNPRPAMRTRQSPDSEVRDLAHCFLRLADLPNYALDRLNRYEGVLWRQAGQILFTLNALHRKKPWERRSYFQFCGPHERRAYDPEEG